MQADETHADLDVRSLLVHHSPAAVAAICLLGDGRALEQEVLLGRYRGLPEVLP